VLHEIGVALYTVSSIDIDTERNDVPASRQPETDTNNSYDIIQLTLLNMCIIKVKDYLLSPTQEMHDTVRD